MRVLVILLLLLCITPAHAQDSLPTPLNADAVFTDAVEVVETLPLLVSDDQQISVWDEATQQWNRYEYPHPISTDRNIDLIRVENGNYIATCDEYLEGATNIYFDSCEIWIFDSLTGNFSNPETICGGYIPTTVGQGYWVLINRGSPQYFFCNTRTGERSVEFPSDFLFAYLESFPGSMLTPDPDLILVLNRNELYIFNLITGNLYKLGDTGDAYRSLINWIDDTRLIFEARLNTPPTYYYLYTADITQPNSLEIVYSMEQQPIPRHENGEIIFYEWMDDTCTFNELSLETGEITTVYFPEVCELGILIPDGSGDRLAFDETTGIVSRFNRYTGEIRALFESPIGGNMHFSPDAHYFEIVVPDETLIFGTLNIYDLQSGELVYIIERTNERNRIVWLDNERFLLYSSDEDKLVNLATGEETLINGVYARSNYPVSPDGRYVLLESDSEALAIYEIATGESRLIAQNFAGYLSSALWEADNTLHVRFTTIEYLPVGDWRVRIVP